jgi:hypothetical protein
LEEISLRNVILKMRYSERVIRIQIRRNPRIRSVAGILRDIFYE